MISWKLSLIGSRSEQLETAVSIQQKRGWTMASLNGTGIHPLPPGAPATGSQVGTRGAPTASFDGCLREQADFGD